MIKNIHIKNFKSVVDLNLELGQFNVFVGENGCGKSNILEAIAMGAASNADKLDYGSLARIGIRTTQPEFMFSAYENGRKKKTTQIDFTDDKGETFPVNLVNDTTGPHKWINLNKDVAYKEIDKIANSIYNENDKTLEQSTQNERELNWIVTIKEIFKEISGDDSFKFITSSLFQSITDRLFKNNYISEFVIYNPEQSALRDFRETTQILPLGIKGEGLFQELKKISLDKKKSSQVQISEIKELLAILDWFEDFDVPGNLLSNEFTLKIKDKYLHKNLDFFDQRSTNEGFLFLLFYFTLFVSKDTPPFFAIDNIEASFNPKLCTRVIQTLTELAKKKKKQVIATTHNPAILDGLDLKDDNQRLFVVSRNMAGHTLVRRIEYNPERTLRLSDIWTKGLIGGLPDNF